MATVLVLTRDPRVRAQLHGALRAHHRVLDASSWAELPGRLLSERIDALAFAPALDEEGGLSGELTWLRRRHSAIGTLLHIGLRGRPYEAFRLGRMGVDGLVVAGLNDRPYEVRTALDFVLARALTRVVTARLDDVDPLELRCLVRATTAAHLAPTIADLAEAEGISVRSLRHELGGRGCLTPGALLRWGCLLRAGASLDRDDRSIEKIAHGLGYSSGHALGRALRREVGFAPTVLKQRGALTCVLEAFRARGKRSDSPGLRSG